MKSEATNSIFNDIVEDIGRNRLPLPTQPKIAVAIQELCENPNVTIEELNEVIVQDPGLTARLIRIANSPLVRGRVSINSLKTAISRLGTHLVANMAIGLATEQLFNAKNKIIEEKMRQAWKHSGDVAGASFAIASYTKAFSPEEAMLAGLLHDIGVLPILTYAESHQDLMKNFEMFEMLIYQFRSDLGETILTSWQFPTCVSDVPKNLTKLDRVVEKPDLTDIVLVAKIHTLRETAHPLALINREEVPAFARLGLDPTVDLCENDKLRKHLEDVQNLFSS
jgi:HD-like signal output (HDOD) protein